MDPMWVRDDKRQPGAASGTDGILGAARYQRHSHTRGTVHDLVVAPVILVRPEFLGDSRVWNARQVR
jgi:hypothetical protein